ncbi:TIGR02302 family protein [Actibacterium sp. D379-3]
MTEIDHTTFPAMETLARPLRLTRWGMLAERVTRAFWPLWTVLLLVLAALAFGVQDHAPQWAVWAGLGVAALAGLWTLIAGLRGFRWPSREAALARLDQTLPGRPIAALRDSQAIGAGDAASEAVWRAHLARMAERVKLARAVAPDLRVSARDPYGLRYVAVTAFAAALLFGSLWRVADVAQLGTGSALAAGPAWEGWIEPPAYTAKPSLYLNDLAPGNVAVSEGSRVTLRLYGEAGALSVSESVSGQALPEAALSDGAGQSFEVVQEGTISIDGPGGREWAVAIAPDQPPVVAFAGPAEWAADGQMEQPFTARDDYGVTGGRATVTLDMGAVDRRYGLILDPEPRAALVLDLPMTITGDRTEFTETIIENLSQHPWSGLPVRMVLGVEDARGQTGQSGPTAMLLPGRRFFDPLARAIIEQRRDLLWTRENGRRVSQVLRAVSYQPETVFRDSAVYLKFRTVLRQLEAGIDAGLTVEARDEVAQVLWDIALQVELGDLSDAMERLQRAQDRLSEAMRNGANEDEIAALMQELQEAMQDYIRQLAQQQQEQGTQQADNQNAQEITGDQLQQMLDRIQELMEQGRMAEAQQLLQQLSEMMQNMQVTQGGDQQSPGAQAMEGLAETLRDQQGLSDQAFRDLQEQFNPGAQAGENPENEGRNGGQGQGQSHDGQQGEGEAQGGDQGEGQQPGQQQSLAERQQALRDELRRQQQGLPGLGGAEGEAARDALDRAGRAMERAEDGLRRDDLAGALDNQAEAMDALREGMRNLGEALAQQQQQNSQGQQGEAMGRANPDQQRDPLGRERGAQGRVGTEESLLQGDDIYGRARELQDEIRRRSADQARPEAELDYLKRLLDRF